MVSRSGFLTPRVADAPHSPRCAPKRLLLLLRVVAAALRLLVRVLLVAALDAAASPSRLKVTHGPAREGEVRRSLLDPSLIASELGWSAGTTLEDGLRLTLEWQQTQL